MACHCTKDRTIGGEANLRFLSREVFHCDEVEGCEKRRSHYVRYTSEWNHRCSATELDGPDCYQRNPLLVAERTVYHNDEDRYVDVARSRYDGAGHFERVDTSDDFVRPNGSTRWAETEYTVTGSTVLAIDPNTGHVNVGTPSSYLPTSDEPWILHPYSKQTSHGGGRTYVTESVFDEKGLVECTRRWRGLARAPQDLVSPSGAQRPGVAGEGDRRGGRKRQPAYLWRLPHCGDGERRLPLSDRPPVRAPDAGRARRCPGLTSTAPTSTATPACRRRPTTSRGRRHTMTMICCRCADPTATPASRSPSV